MNKDALTTRLGQYISLVLPDAHGHQQKAVCDFVRALVSVQTCCQAALARFFDNFEAASKRLSRLLHNARLETEALAAAHARALLAQLPVCGPVRLSLDWTTEDTQHLLVASLRVGGRAVPLYWRAYHDTELKGRMTSSEQEFVRFLCEQVLCGLQRQRFILTADRWFADVDLLDLLDEMGVSYIIRTKSNYKVLIDGHWRTLGSLHWRGNQRRRAWGRVWYTQTDPRRVYLAQARARDAKGKWGIWHLLSNRNLSATRMSQEYALRFTCEEGFRDGKRLLGFAEARIADLKAWARMFTLVAIALLVLTTMGCALLERVDHAQWLRRVRSRRSERSELSLVRSIVELLAQDESWWQLLSHHRLNLEASL
ncbi:MAG: transposase [Acidobacteria bacterium]|nr:transposase [Acidobacteriota bacterium]